MRCLLICYILLLQLSLTVYGRKEFGNLASYQAEYPQGKHDGSDGNWLTVDRKKFSQIWNKANEYNLTLSNGFEAYRSLAERAAFYNWFQQKTEKLGFTTQWAKLAASTTHKLGYLMSPLSKLVGYSNEEIQQFIFLGNQLIFDDCWPKLMKLSNGSVLKDEKARTWDEKILIREQELIHPHYLKLKHQSIRKLERLLQKESFPLNFVSGCEFEGSLLSIQDVYAYGMKRMGYAEK